MFDLFIFVYSAYINISGAFATQDPVYICLIFNYFTLKVYSVSKTMAIYDASRGGYRIFVGDLGRQAGKYDLEKEFQRYGTITDVWVAR